MKSSALTCIHLVCVHTHLGAIHILCRHSRGTEVVGVGDAIMTEGEGGSGHPDHVISYNQVLLLLLRLLIPLCLDVLQCCSHIVGLRQGHR